MIYMNEPLEFVFRFRRVSGGSIIGLVKGGKSMICKKWSQQLKNQGDFSRLSLEIF